MMDRFEEMEENTLGTAHYWLRGLNPPWISVSKEVFMEAEKRAGFNSSDGPGHLATAGFATSNIEGRITHGNEPRPSGLAPLLAPPDTAYHDLALVYGQVSKMHQLMVDLGIAINQVNAAIPFSLAAAMDEVNTLYVELQAQIMELGREPSSQESMSRSVQRRKAAQQGRKPPDFGREPSDKEAQELAQGDQDDQAAQAAPTVVPEDAQEDDGPGRASHDPDASAKPAR